jgi:hypothetical protein
MISFESLLKEMTDLERLSYLPEQPYRVLQYSSYDRRSVIPGQPEWFANSDGFGNEPVPGFEAVIAEPDEEGIGTYLVCDLQGPGVIQRLWTAGINGKIRCYFDDADTPAYDGKAEDFFWNTAGALSGLAWTDTLQKIFRQFDATYFPVPFKQRLRIEWSGDIQKIHFYQVGIRLYEGNASVKTFSPADIPGALAVIEGLFRMPELPAGKMDGYSLEVERGEESIIYDTNGTGVLDYFAARLSADDIESALRKSVLKIYFDNSAVPQVEAPLGDFFGAAPGINPYHSLPFSVLDDSMMVCRFQMPFRDSIRIVVENLSDGPVNLSGRYHIGGYDWKEGISMHFRTGWKLDNGLEASNTIIRDIPYQIIRGRGRIVGAAAFLYNPSQAVTSWGNWWGEGDEKIFIDREKFPSFFGTGSEDYFNYSWSSADIFYFPYCGQPRNDGPGNRGHVSNFRWHVADDLIFDERISFYMELLHHGSVPGFSYGRMVHAYALPGVLDDRIPVSAGATVKIPYEYWEPEAYLGSAGYQFYQAEELLTGDPEVTFSAGNRWAGGKILFWQDSDGRGQLEFNIIVEEEGAYTLGMTLAHLPGGGTIRTSLNDELLESGGKEIMDLNDPGHIQLRNHFFGPVRLTKGDNRLAIIQASSLNGNKIGIDFFWLKKK